MVVFIRYYGLPRMSVRGPSLNGISRTRPLDLFAPLKQRFSWVKAQSLVDMG